MAFGAIRIRAPNIPDPHVLRGASMKPSRPDAPTETPADPIALFREELERARPNEPLAGLICALATASREGRPSVRYVLLKDADARGFVFYTNQTSRKAREIAENPYASLAFHWKSTGVQVRVEGQIELVTDAEADAYFASRERDSQIGAWASKQSAILENRAELEEAVAQYETKYAGGDVPRPPHWGGYRLVPTVIELWYDRPHRLHDRFEYRRVDDGWHRVRLSP